MKAVLPVSGSSWISPASFWLLRACCRLERTDSLVLARLIFLSCPRMKGALNPPATAKLGRNAAAPASNRVIPGFTGSASGPNRPRMLPWVLSSRKVAGSSSRPWDARKRDAMPKTVLALPGSSAWNAGPTKRNPCSIGARPIVPAVNAPCSATLALVSSMFFSSSVISDGGLRAFARYASSTASSIPPKPFWV